MQELFVWQVKSKDIKFVEYLSQKEAGMKKSLVESLSHTLSQSKPLLVIVQYVLFSSITAINAKSETN